MHYIVETQESGVSRAGDGVGDGDGVAAKVDEALALALHRELAHEVTDEGVAAEGTDVRARYGEHLAEESLCRESICLYQILLAGNSNAPV